MLYTVIRNNQTFGPFSLESLALSVEDGKLLKNDNVFENDRPDRVTTIGKLLRQNGISVTVKHNGSLFKQLSRYSRELLFPKEIFRKETWTGKNNLLFLALIGLGPLFLSVLMFNDLLTFYVISLYFSVVWGLFFYSFFKTRQVNLKTTLYVFFCTQICIFLIFGLGISKLNLFYFLDNQDALLLRLLFFVFAVGVTEEFSKAIPLFVISKRSKEVLIPHTFVFYGLISGLAFGVFEGVQYQMGQNALLEYSESFYLNIARLTSLPFLHAVWCGIAGYFIGFASIYPKYRRSLYFLAIALPALLHGVYDTCVGRPLGIVVSIPVTLFAVALLMCYFNNDREYREHLKK